MSRPCRLIPGSAKYTLQSVNVPASSQEVVDLKQYASNSGLCPLDIHVADGKIASIHPHSNAGRKAKLSESCPVVNCCGGVVFPLFTDLNTRLGKLNALLFSKALALSPCIDRTRTGRPQPNRKITGDQCETQFTPSFHCICLHQSRGEQHTPVASSIML